MALENHTKSTRLPSRLVKLLLYICETAPRELCYLPDQRIDTKKMEWVSWKCTVMWCEAKDSSQNIAILTRYWKRALLWRGQILKQFVQKDCSISFPGSVQDWTEHLTGQSVLNICSLNNGGTKWPTEVLWT